METEKKIERVYPYKAWALQPSFRLIEIELVKPYGTWGNADYGDLTENGKLYARPQIYLTQEDAIKGGNALLDKQQLDLDKKAANLAKRRAALVKAAEALNAAERGRAV